MLGGASRAMRVVVPDRENLADIASAKSAIPCSVVLWVSWGVVLGRGAAAAMMVARKRLGRKIGWEMDWDGRGGQGGGGTEGLAGQSKPLSTVDPRPKDLGLSDVTAFLRDRPRRRPFSRPNSALLRLQGLQLAQPTRVDDRIQRGRNLVTVCSPHYGNVSVEATWLLTSDQTHQQRCRTFSFISKSLLAGRPRIIDDTLETGGTHVRVIQEKLLRRNSKIFGRVMNSDGCWGKDG